MHRLGGGSAGGQQGDGAQVGGWQCWRATGRRCTGRRCTGEELWSCGSGLRAANLARRPQLATHKAHKTSNKLSTFTSVLPCPPRFSHAGLPLQIPRVHISPCPPPLFYPAQVLIALRPSWLDGVTPQSPPAYSSLPLPCCCLLAPESVSFSSDSAKLASASADRTARVWDAKSGRQLLHCEGHGGGINCVVCSPTCTQVRLG
eukprot:366163-Chlamydomonas_euryale.AAC.13